MILLINPPMSFEEHYGKFSDISPDLPPLGLTYMAAVLEKNNFDVQIIDAQILRLDFNTLSETLKNLSKKPKIIGITCLTSFYKAALKTAELVKEIFPDCLVAMGGPHVTISPEDPLKKDFVDVVVRHEGEYTLLDLAKNIHNLKEIKGISYKKDDKIIHNENREFIKNLDELPFPARHLIPRTDYRAPPDQQLASPTDSIMTTRGCPYSCTFCSSGLIWGHNIRSRSINNVVDEVELLVNKYKVKSIIFMDDTFFPGKEMEFCKEMIKRGLHKKVEWSCETRVNMAEEEKMKLMKKAGCKYIFFGVEAADDELLKRINKKITIPQVKKAIKMAKKIGFITRTSFIIGLPGETREQSLKTLKFAKELDADFSKWSVFVPYPGTKEFYTLKDEIKNFNWDDYLSIAGYLSRNPIYVPKGRTYEELAKLQKEFHRKYYMRPGKVFRHLTKIRNFRDIKRYFKAGKVMLSN
jgi:radical SAM superfamily enzyme YgiQ (UPF0313 family)